MDKKKKVIPDNSDNNTLAVVSTKLKEQSQQCDDTKNYTEQQLAERFDDVEIIASFLAHIKNEKQTEPEPCKGYGHCCYYGEWDCDSCIAANKIYEYFKAQKIPK